MKNKAVQIQTAVNSKEEAQRLADAILKGKLAACIQMFPILSNYWWEDKIEESEEFILLIKTKEDNYKKIEELIKKLHTYEVPEILSIPISAISSEYFNWIKQEIS